MSVTNETKLDSQQPLSKTDFQTDQEVRWCPGCGDYSVLAAVQKLLPTLGIPQENFVFVSGIGCSSRFPYYINSYGMHTIHGRAPAFATGVKLSNPELSVWLVTGDGDALSIGGNHILHLLRRNVDLTVLLFNNRIYGLTKGQYSPTSGPGTVTKSTPHGSLDAPVNPLAFALGSGASFVARTLDVDAKHMAEVFQAAAMHRGTSFVEIFQNCVIFNDDAFVHIADRSQRADNQLVLRKGELLTFGKESGKGIRLNNLRLEIIGFEPGNVQQAVDLGVIRFDPENKELALLLAQLDYPNFPVPMGVIYRHIRPTYNDLVHEQLKAVQLKKPVSGTPDEVLKELFHSGDTWTVAS